GRGLDARERVDAIDQRAVELSPLFRLLIFVTGPIVDREGQDVVGIEPELDVAESEECSRQQAGTGEQNEREGGLRGYEDGAGTVAQARSRTSRTAPSRISSAGRAGPNHSCASGVSTTLTAGAVGAWIRSCSALIALSSARACSTVAPGATRPTTVAQPTLSF